MSRRDNELYEFGEFRLDVAEHRLTRTDNAPVPPIPEKAFQTLVYLLRNAGHLVRKEELLDAVWPEATVEENNLDKAIHSIRQTLREKPGEQRYIETVRKHGYRFVASVEVTVASAPVDRYPGRESSSGLLGISSNRSSRFRNAFEAVQLARLKYCQMTAPSTLEARELVSAALMINPEFIPALALSAEITTLEVIVGLKHPRSGFREARAALAQARELGADSAEYHASVGYVDLIEHWDFPSAEANLKKALDLNPHLATANRMLAETYMFQGRDDQASVFIGRAQSEDLMGIHNLNIVAISHFLARRYPEVVKTCRAMLKLSPGHIIPTWTMCWAFEQMGHVEQAIAGYERILELPHGEPVLRWAGYAYALAGERDIALEIAVKLEAAMKIYNISRTHLATLNGALGNLDTAIGFIEDAVEMRDPFVLWIGRDPRFDPLRSEQRFKSIIEEVGFFRWKHGAEDRSIREGRSQDKEARARGTGLPPVQSTKSGAHIMVSWDEWSEFSKQFDSLKSGEDEPEVSQ